MAVSAGTAFVGIEGDFSALNKQVSSHFTKLSKQAGPAGKKIGKSLGAGMSTGIGVGAKVAAVGLGALTAEVIKATKGWSEHQAIVRRSNAVIKSTGGVANVSAKHIGVLTDAIERQVGVDGDLAAEGANLLLTFTNIRNGVGKNNKVFDEATKTAVNMSKALGTDVKGSAIQLGKALNDPIKGVSALQRVGVSFDAQQKKQIKTLVESGKTMEAQKLILGELAKEFPKVKATPFERLVSVGRQVEDTIGKAVLPAFENFVSSVTPKLQHVASAASDIFDDKNLSWGEKFQKLGASIKHWFGPVADDMIQALKDAHLDQKLADVIKWAEPKVLDAVKAIAPKAANMFIQGFLDAPGWARIAITGWLLKKMGGLPALRAAGVTAGTQVGAGMASGVSTGTTGLKGKALALGKTIGTNLAIGAAIAFGPEIVKNVNQRTIKGASPKFDLPEHIVEPLGAAIGPLGDVEKWLQGLTGEKINKLQSFGDTAESTFTKLAKAKDVRGLDALANQARSLATEFPQAGDELRAFAFAVDQAAKDSVGSFRDIAQMGGRKLRDIKTVAANTGQAIKQDLGADTKAGKEALAKNFAGAATAIQKSMDAGVISTKTGTAQIEYYMVQALMNMGFTEDQAVKLRKGQDPFTGKAIGGKQNLTGKQRGGYINMGAASGDSVHALLERDEYVLNRKAVRKIGKAALDRLNFGEAPRFQKGGSVTGDTDFLPALMNALKAMSAAVGRSIYVQSGRRTVAEQLALIPTRSASHPVAGPNGPHVRGIAADITPGREVFGSAAGRFGLGFTVPQEAWHVQLVDAAAAGAQALGAVTAPAIQKLAAIGPNSPLRNLVQGALDATHTGAQALVNRAATLMQPETGEAAPTGGVATGNGADLMRQISKQRGWNFGDWWALDDKESSHGANLTNPQSSARLRGQFMDFNYGKYGPGSDPAQNPSMAQQIESMAAYIADRYGNPTKAWAVWQSHFPPGWYQRGGQVLASLFQRGGTAKGAKVNNPLASASKGVKKKTPNDRITQAMTAALGQADATALQTAMDTLKNEADKYADWADRAGNIVDTDALQKALNDEMTARGGRSGMTQSQLDALFKPEDQNKFIDAWLRNPANGAMFNSGIQSDWLTSELNQLLAWRISLIDNQPIFQQMAATAYGSWKTIRDTIATVKQQIADAVIERDRVAKAQDDQHKALVDAKGDLADEQRKKKPDKARVRRLQEHVDKYRRNEDALRDGTYEEMKSRGLIKQINGHDAWKHSHVYYNNQLAQWRSDNRTREQTADSLGGDDGKGGRIGDLNEAVSTMTSSLNDVQGLGSTMQKFTNWDAVANSPPLGTLGGTILGVQNSILSLTKNPPRASAEEAGAQPTEGEARQKEIDDLIRQSQLQELQRQGINAVIGNAFTNLPFEFGGSFEAGGTVPGPVGAPRMILAHGGEVVIPNDASVGPNVSLHFANGMEWLRQFVDVRVDNQTRAQSRRSERGLPGQGSRR